MPGPGPRQAWLSLTPEPERELPASVATLRAGRRAGADEVARERARIERLVVRARRGAWLAYLREVVELIERAGEDRDDEVGRARTVALEVMRNHHHLLVGVPGPAADRTAGERSRLDAVASETPADGGGR